MVRVVATFPLVGLTESQLPPEVVDVVAVNVRVAPTAMITAVWLGGVGAPMV